MRWCKGIEEQLSGACTTEIAAFDEFTALLTDTALTSATPTSFSTPRPPATPSACCSCPVPGAAFWKRARATPRAWGRWPGWRSSAAQYKAAVDALADPARTRLVLVARAQPPRCARPRAPTPSWPPSAFRQQYLVINGVLPGGRSRGTTRWPRRCVGASRRPWPPCPKLPARAATDQIAAQALQPGRAGRPAPPAARFSAHRHRLTRAGARLPRWSRPALPRWWTTSPQDGHGLVMLMGKGGVGKTTLAAAVAVELAGAACRCT
jgi:arsenite-transporting ATPase